MPVSGLAGAKLYRELNETLMPESAHVVGRAIAVRMIEYPGKPLGGVASLAAAVEKKTGWRISERAVHYAIRRLRKLGFVAVDCCAGDACVGGRHHACQFKLGPRPLSGGWRRVGRFFVRKGAQNCRASRGDVSPLDSVSKEEPAARPRRRSGDATHPPPHREGGARGPTAIADVIAQLRLGGAAPAFGP